MTEPSAGPGGGRGAAQCVTVLRPGWDCLWVWGGLGAVGAVGGSGGCTCAARGSCSGDTSGGNVRAKVHVGSGPARGVARTRSGSCGSLSPRTAAGGGLHRWHLCGDGCCGQEEQSEEANMSEILDQRARRQTEEGI